jgi:hypothetical protein
VIVPATAAHGCSFAELVCDEEQPPDYFVTMWWGTGLVDTLRCLVHHSYERGLESEYGYHQGEGSRQHPLYLGGRSPRYWLDVSAITNHNLASGELMEAADDAWQSAFARAVRHAKGTVSIVDRYELSP